MLAASVLAANILAVLTPVAVKPPGLSRETGMPLEATLSLAVRVAFTRVPSAATTTAERPEAIPPAEAPAWVAEAFTGAEEEEGTAAVAGGGNHRFVTPTVSLKSKDGDKSYATNQAECLQISLG